MNANAVAKHYGLLTPEERFPLIVAAIARGDGMERERLLNAAQRITLSLSDHAPCAFAFNELSLHLFTELLDTAADYLEAFQQADAAEVISDAESEDEADDAEAEPAADLSEIEPKGEDRPLAERWFDLALALGYILKTRVDAWKLFCERMNLPPFATWECSPGFDRLQRALKLAEQAAFVPGGMVRWLNRLRPEGEPEVTDVPFTAEEAAAALDRFFRKRVAWWGGE
jgi:hypothetical protein